MEVALCAAVSIGGYTPAVKGASTLVGEMTRAQAPGAGDDSASGAVRARPLGQTEPPEYPGNTSHKGGAPAQRGPFLVRSGLSQASRSSG